MHWREMIHYLHRPKAERDVKALGGKALRRAVKLHAAKLLAPIFDQPFADEVFLAGGAFKPLLKRGHLVRDLDLWVRNRKVRERLCAHLIAGGAELVHDFRPYCIKFSKRNVEIEITYQNVKGSMMEVLAGFDIAACSVAATYQDGAVTDCLITARAERSFLEREIFLNEGYIARLEARRSPDVLQSIDRIGQFAEDFDLDLPTELCERLWGVYENVYTIDEREACLGTYLKTTVDYKGRCDLSLLKRASAVSS
ncbi:MAG: hypothetical protein ACI9MB_000672 [Verrucomicrobiales bacterium]|jgi:hypothetical protein